MRRQFKNIEVMKDIPYIFVVALMNHEALGHKRSR